MKYHNFREQIVDFLAPILKPGVKVTLTLETPGTFKKKQKLVWVNKNVETSVLRNP